MERLGHQFLARAAFAGYEHGGLKVRQIFYQGIDLLHPRILADDVIKLPAFIQVLPESGQARYIPQHQDSAGEFAPLLQEWKGAHPRG